MKLIQHIGLFVFLAGIIIFSGLSFIGDFQLKDADLKTYLTEQEYDNLAEAYSRGGVTNQVYSSPQAFSEAIITPYNKVNEAFKAEQMWDKVMWNSPHEFALGLLRKSAQGPVSETPMMFFWLTFGLCIFGGLMMIVPNVILLGPKGIKNNQIYQRHSTNRGWIAYIVFAYLIGFYIILYFYPNHLVNQIMLLDPISQGLSGNNASQWFLYGFMYCSVMTVMAVRMYIKYRHNRYQLVRTTSVLFFQLAFAFLIPELLVRFNMPYMDFKNAWPLDYDFFFDWNLNTLIASGNVGLFMLFWGVVLTLIIVPVLSYFYGKRWYCSWVCGCGGLAETLGDPYRQHSDKSLKAWKFERYIVHGVLVFAVIMTGATLGSYFSGNDYFLGIGIYDIQKSYGFLIGSIFSGVIGTGFYPIFGNRVWCRMGCPLAAYMGIVQRFKSKFRITTNGGQCISCGNCSTYCEQGIDVRWYAQRGQNIVRSSCVGCGVCSAVCPRGVLKLENGPEEGRINEMPDILGIQNRDEFK